MPTPTVLSLLALIASCFLVMAERVVSASESETPEPFGEVQVDFTIGEQTRMGRLVTPDSRLPSPAMVLLLDDSQGRFPNAALTALKKAYLSEGFAVFLVENQADEPTSFAQQTADALVAIRALRERPEVEPMKIGLLSLGGTGAWVGSRIAQEDPDLAYLILISAPMESPEVHRLRSRGLVLLDRYDLELPVVDRITRFRSAYWDYLDTGDGYDKLVAELGDLKQKSWYTVSGLPEHIRTAQERSDLPDGLRIFLEERRVDPLESLSRVSCPLLAIYGDLDKTMPASEFAVRLHFLAGALDMDLTVKTYANLGHSLMQLEPASKATDSMEGHVIAEMVRWTLKQVETRLNAASKRRTRDSQEENHPVSVRAR